MTLDTEKQQFRSGRRRGVSEERARTIRFLRAAAEDNQGEASALNAAADAIERGDHTRLVGAGWEKAGEKDRRERKPTTLGEIASRIQEYLRDLNRMFNNNKRHINVLLYKPRVRRAGNRIIILRTY